MTVNFNKINTIGPSSPGSIYNRLYHIKDLVNLDSWRVVLDIGACDGAEGIGFAETFSDVNVYSFEPAPANVARCNENYAKLDPAIKSRVNLVQAALSDSTKSIKFMAIDENRARIGGAVNYGMGSILKIIDPKVLPWHYSVQMEVEAQAYTMDDWINQQSFDKVDAIWMDVQGAELLVMKGAEKALENIQVIMTEAGIIPYYHGHTMKADIDEFLAQRGFIELIASRVPHDQGLETNTIYINKKFMQNGASL